MVELVAAGAEGEQALWIDGRLSQVTFFHDLTPVECASELTLLAAVQRTVTAVMMHEALEAVRYQGRHVVDPHPERPAALGETAWLAMFMESATPPAPAQTT